MVDRPAEDIAREVDLADVLRVLRKIATVIGIAAAGQREAHPEMPFPETTGHVSLLLKHTRDRETVLGDERR